MTSLDVSSLGWDEQFSSAFSDLDELADACPGELVPARVTRVDRGACDGLTPAGPLRATFSGAVLAAGAADPGSTPCVGDWI
ncbi:MAG: ribosome small subunit-dependent GTPase A, partial [Sporichthyaceae bacterium]